MKCEDIRRHFSEYIDLEAPPEIATAIEEHIATCGECRDDLEAYRCFQAAVSSVGEEELPFDFAVTLRSKLEEENKNHKKKRPVTSRGWFKVLAACACLVLVIGVFSLGVNLFGFRGGATAAPMDYRSTDTASAEMPSSNTMDWNGAEAPMAEPMEAEFYMEDTVAEEGGANATATGKIASVAAIERKIIKNYSLSLKVEDFDAAYEEISNLATEFGGYVVGGNSYDYEGSTYRDGWLSIRVDAERVDQVIERIGELGTVENNSFSTNDVTSDYYDTQTRLEQYRAQEERLMELYAQAETIGDLIALESELTRVTTEIESLEGMIRYYDQLTALSLIDINLYTPSTYTQTVEPTGWAGFWNNVKSGFLRGVNGLLDAIANIFIFLVRILPALILIAVILLVLVLTFRKGRRKGRKANKE